MATEFVGKRLRHARDAQNARQEDVAVKAGITRTQLANIEAGRTDPSLSTFVALLRVLGLEAGKVLSEPSCEHCGDFPPVGYTCNRCGSGAGDG